MRSLLVLGLPRSLTTLVYHAARQALRLRQPVWTGEGEILNASRFCTLDGGLPPQDRRFVRRDDDPQIYEQLKQFLDEAVVRSGYAYKDVIQPFVASEWAAASPLAILVLRRPVADVAFAMRARGWNYPAAAAADLDGSDEERFVGGLLRAEAVLARAPGEHIEFDELITDEAVLWQTLQRLYPDIEVEAFSFADDEFREKRRQSLAARKTDTYLALAETVAKLTRIAAVQDRVHAVPETGARPARSRPRLLVVGDALAPTGFARVTHSILYRLSDRFEIHQLGVNYHGPVRKEPWTIHCAGESGHPQGTNRIVALMQELQPELVFLVNDLWILADYLAELRPHRANCRIVVYCPIDADPILPSSVQPLIEAHRIVVYTDFGRKALETAANDVAAHVPGFHLPPVQVVPHGVDTSIFKPLFPGQELAAARRSVRRQIFPGADELQDAFIVLNGNRNQPRKRIDISMQGFALFAANKPDNVKLYLHMGALDHGWDVRLLAQRLGIVDRLVISTEDMSHPEVSQEQLNLVYNACDVGLNTSEAEGWGLVAFEHGATRAAQVVPDHSAPGQLWRGAAEMLQPSLNLVTPGAMTVASVIAPETVAAALDRLYASPELLQRRSQEAYRFATQGCLRWDTIATTFESIFSEELIQESKLAVSGTILI